MISNTKQDRRVLSNERAALKVGNLFDTVLVLAGRMRELRSGAAPLLASEPTMLGTAYREAEEGHLSRERLYRPQNRSK